MHRARPPLAGSRNLTTWLNTTTVGETAQFVRDSNCVTTMRGGDPVLRPMIDSLFEVRPEDFSVTVPAGWSTIRLNEELEPYGLVLPRHCAMRAPVDMSADFSWAVGVLSDTMTIGEGIAWNLPHILEAQHGTWRDWLLDATFVTAAGEVCHAGARVSKNVAGFDIHKLIIGSRGAFVVPVSFTLRVIPLSAVREPVLIFSPQFGDFTPERLHSIQRVLPIHFAEATSRLVETNWFADPSTSTIYILGDHPAEIARFEGDWLIALSGDAPGLEFFAAEAWAILRTKELFDPTKKLNPGALGIV